jgi:hypothetical protein
MGDDDTFALITFKASHRQFAELLSELRSIKTAVQELPKPDFRTKRLTLTKVTIDFGAAIEGEIKKMQLTDTQQATIEFGAPVDKKGFPAKVQEGSVVISIDDAAQATVTQDTANPLKAQVVALAPSDVPTMIRIKADADLGDGVELIEGSEPYNTTSSKATGFGAPTIGTPEEQP